MREGAGEREAERQGVREGGREGKAVRTKELLFLGSCSYIANALSNTGLIHNGSPTTSSIIHTVKRLKTGRCGPDAMLLWQPQPSLKPSPNAPD